MLALVYVNYSKANVYSVNDH